jgi:hypothetical protein
LQDQALWLIHLPAKIRVFYHDDDWRAFAFIKSKDKKKKENKKKESKKKENLFMNALYRLGYIFLLRIEKSLVEI